VTAEPWRAAPEGVIVSCRLTPRGGRDAIEGVVRLADGRPALVARVRAPPEDGRANEALCALLADSLGASPSGVRLVAGGKSRLKEVLVAGDPESLIARLRSF
jgi:uncharacterized protein (TIGR00251 family)